MELQNVNKDACVMDVTNEKHLAVSMAKEVSESVVVLQIKELASEGLADDVLLKIIEQDDLGDSSAGSVTDGNTATTAVWNVVNGYVSFLNINCNKVILYLPPTPFFFLSNCERIAYIEFKTEADADKALEDNQGADLKGRAMLIDFIGSKSQNVSKRKEPYQSGKESKTVVINNLAYSATEASIQDIFEKASSIRIPQKNGRPKGFAFVDFETVEDAKEALETYNNTEIEGRTVRLEYSQSDKSVFKSGKLTFFFSCVLFCCYIDCFRDIMSKEHRPSGFKLILQLSMFGFIFWLPPEKQNCFGNFRFGFVDFRTEEEAKAAKEAMEDGEIDGSRVTLDYAKPKGESQGGFRGGRGGRFRGGGRGGGGRGGGRGGGGGRGFGGRGGGGGFGGGFRGRHDNTPRGKKIKFGD
ncbi:nucleolin [Protopterus annectens]|uniref:nucleolin n=1 Tax=Protopterus annectens TaxID=7888 RepID=UPI001CF9A5C1|nr:nucleolin [Protopterus annectens]